MTHDRVYAQAGGRRRQPLATLGEVRCIPAPLPGAHAPSDGSLTREAHHGDSPDGAIPDWYRRV